MEEQASDQSPSCSSTQAVVQASDDAPTAPNPETHPLQVALYYTLQLLHNILAKSVFLEGAGQMRLSELREQFERRVGRPIPVRGVGYGSLRELVCSFDGLFVVKRDTAFPGDFDSDKAYVVEPQPQPAFFIILLELVSNPDKYNFSPPIEWVPLQPLEETQDGPQNESSSGFQVKGGSEGIPPSTVSPQSGELCETAISPPLKKRKKSGRDNETTSFEKPYLVEGNSKAQKKLHSKLLLSPLFICEAAKEIIALFESTTNPSGLTSAQIGQCVSFKNFRQTWTQKGFETKTSFPKMSDLLERLKKLGIIKIYMNGCHIVVCGVKTKRLLQYERLMAGSKQKEAKIFSSKAGM